MQKPQITYFPSTGRGAGEYGWLSTRYSFSFANWYAPDRMGFGALRVLNDDIIRAGGGFGMHGHRDMEIVTIVTGGTLRHTDNLGTDGLVTKGEVQVMSAGTGILHSEVNAGPDDLTLFQLWITPNKKNVTPRYDQKTYSVQDGETLLVGPMGHPNTLTIHQEAYISRITHAPTSSAAYTLKNEANGVYLFVIAGSITTHEHTASNRDAIGVRDILAIEYTTGPEGADILVIEVPVQET
jgi:redox-sensitive bicupin YhaK (pirin superfamily)